MIEILSSKRMIVYVAILIIICTIIILIEEWFTNNQLPISPDLLIKSTSKPAKIKFSNFSINVDVIDIRKSHLAQQTDWRAFLSFFSLSTLAGSISGLLVRYRQQQLRNKTLARFRTSKEGDSKSTDSGDSSNHALIDMSSYSY